MVALPKVGQRVNLPGYGPSEIEVVSHFGTRVRPLRHERITGTDRSGNAFEFMRRPRAVTISTAAVEEALR